MYDGIKYVIFSWRKHSQKYFSDIEKLNTVLLQFHIQFSLYVTSRSQNQTQNIILMLCADIFCDVQHTLCLMSNVILAR